MNNLDLNRTNALLEEVNNERNRLFNEIKQESDKLKEQKMRCLQNISSQLITYKNILNKEKQNDI